VGTKPPVVVDYWRQLDLFSPEKFGNTEVHVVGCGATGSYVALLLAKMGVTNLHLWDFDEVEAHNLPNQVFRLRDVGRTKVDALAEIIEDACGIKPILHAEAVTGETTFAGIVFLLVDSMDIRRDIWLGALKFKLPIELMIETRMAIDNGRIYAIRPSRPADIRLWEGSIYASSEAEESACTNRSIAPTVAFISSLAVWKLVKWHKGEEFQSELILSARPSIIIGN
jgi:molybdopterin/thiamine biosynthesis adenylyltransferase